MSQEGAWDLPEGAVGKSCRGRRRMQRLERVELGKEVGDQITDELGSEKEESRKRGKV